MPYKYAGRIASSWKREKTYIILLAFLYAISNTSKRGPRLRWIRQVNKSLKRFSPYQIITMILAILHCLRNFNTIFGFDLSEQSPDYLYSKEYNRATWIVTGLDAGFATAMSIHSKWLRDICSLLFSVYYLVDSDGAKYKLQKLREVCTLDMLRATWNKTDNPYLRIFTWFSRVSLPIRRKITLPRPTHTSCSQPIVAWLFFDGSEAELARSTELILDFPGGGFIAMGPTHHEERLSLWAKQLKRPILSIDYRKAPEYPYPYAIEECFDVYRTIVESTGRIIGMNGSSLHTVLTGDSAGGNIAVNVMLKIIESQHSIPHPAGLALTYAALNFSFTSWAWLSSQPTSLHLDVPSPFFTSSVLPPALITPHLGSLNKKAREQGIGFPKYGTEAMGSPSKLKVQNAFATAQSDFIMHQHTNLSLFEKKREALVTRNVKPFKGSEACNRDGMSYQDHYKLRSSNVEDIAMFEASQCSVKGPIYQQDMRTADLRLTMSSKASYCHDRILTPSMAWAMCILYLGPTPQPGVEHDYHLSPIYAPDELLASFPPMLMQCGGRDPLVDDTIQFAGRVVNAKKVARETTNHGDSVLEAKVATQIFPGWSHGYLQMSAIMPEACVAIDDIAGWIAKRFERREREIYK